MQPTARQLKTFIKSIKTFLKDSEMSPTELAESLDFKSRTIQSWLNGTRRPTLEKLTDFTVKMKALQLQTTRNSAALDKFFQAV